MKSRLLVLAGLALMAVACQKGNTGPQKQLPAEGFTDVKIKFTGDLLLSESPLGRTSPDNHSLEKTFADSTVYAITVSKNGTPVYNGLFSKTDSINLKIPVSGAINVSAVALRKGTGPGIFCYVANGDFRYPWFGPIAYNKLDTVRFGLDYNIDSINNINMFNATGTQVDGDPTRDSEIDTYVGRTNFDAAQTPAVVTLQMRRIVFGIRYNISNFSSGRLIADFGGLMPTKYLTTTDSLNKQFVYTANELQWSDSLYAHPVNITLNWQKADNSLVLLGKKQIAFKRNVLTTINVTIPAQTTGAPNMPIDTSFQQGETINF